MPTVFGPNVTNLRADPSVRNDVALDGGRLRVKTGTIELATGDIDDDDIIVLERLPANAVIHDIEIMNDDLDSDGSPTLAFDIGVYLADAAGTVKDRDAYALAATTLQAATTDWVGLLSEARDIDEVGQKVFEDAGDSDESEGEYDIAMTIETVAATAVAGTLSWKITYTVD